MSRPTRHRLLNALEAETGRQEPTDVADRATPSSATPSSATPSSATPSSATPSSATPSSATPSRAWREHARLLIQTRRAVVKNEACPPAYLRRVQGLFGQSRASTPGLLRLVFDSWRELQPALRGTGSARSLRYEGDDTAVDVRLLAEGKTQVLVQVAVEPAHAGLSIELIQSGRSRPEKVALDGTGSAQVRLPRTSPSVVIAVREGERVILRLPPVPLD